MEPFGEERADLRNAMLMHLIASIMTEQGKRPPGVEEFMPFYEDEEKEPKSADQIAAMMRATYRKKT